jgi:hypothetical protein
VTVGAASAGEHTAARPGPTQRLRPAEAVARRRAILVRGSEIAIMLKKRIGEPNSTLAEDDASATGERVLKADLPAARPRARKAILPLAAADRDRGLSTMPSCWRWRVPFLGGHAHVTLTSRQQILDPIPFVVVQSIAPQRSALLKADCRTSHN